MTYLQKLEKKFAELANEDVLLDDLVFLFFFLFIISFVFLSFVFLRSSRTRPSSSITFFWFFSYHFYFADLERKDVIAGCDDVMI